MLCKYLKGCGGINAFILVRNSTNLRFDLSFQQMLKSYSKMFGANFFDRLIIIASRCDQNNDTFEDMNIAKSMKESLIELAHSIPSPKFECEDICSPINELYSKET